MGSARGGRDTTTEYCRSAAAATIATGAAGEREAGCGRAATVAGGGGRCALAAAFGGHTAGRGAGRRREDWCQRTAPAAAEAAAAAAARIVAVPAQLAVAQSTDPSTATGPAASR